MADDFPVVIHHNPNCTTSRNTLEMIRQSGREPTIHEYVKTGWTRPQLEDLLRKMGKTAHEVLRVRGTPAEELGLTGGDATDAQILDAMVAHPILVERPIVETPKGVRLCRPADTVRELL